MSLSRHSSARRPSWLTATARRLGLEPLEDRCNPAPVNVVVDTNDPNSMSGTDLAEAVTMVNTMGDPSGNSITIQTDGQFNLSSTLQLKKGVTITGPGQASFIVNGQDNVRPFLVDNEDASSIEVVITGLTVVSGKADFGGGVLNENETLTLRNVTLNGNSATTSGGGFASNGGTTRIEGSKVNGNRAEVNGGGVFSQSGGFLTVVASEVSFNSDVSNDGLIGGGLAQSGSASKLFLVNSLVEGNQATGGDTDGGGLAVTGGVVNILGSTFVDNQAGSRGGGMRLSATTATVQNSTFTGNEAAEEGGGIFFTGAFGSLVLQNVTIARNRVVANNTLGGGLNTADADSPDQIQLFNTLIALNKTNSPDPSAGDPNDVAGTVDAAVSKGNYIDTGDAGLDTASLFGNQTDAPDPLLGPLGRNGGLTPTLPLLTGSMAIDRGNTDSADPLTTDQRGLFARVNGGRVDVGAYESGAATVTLTVGTAADSFEPSVPADPNADPDTSLPPFADPLSLREALALAGGEAAVITFDPLVSGQTITLTQGPLVVAESVEVRGPGADQLTISGDDRFRVLEISEDNPDRNIIVGLSGLTVADGKAKIGSGILVRETLGLFDVVVRDNTSTLEDDLGGAGILVFANGRVSLSSSAVVNNTSFGDGGGIQVLEDADSLTIDNSTVAGNTAKRSGGGVFVFGDAATVTIRNSTIANNTAESDGAGGGKGGGLFVDDADQVPELIATIIGSNTVGATGSGKDISGKAKLTFSLISDTAGWVQTATGSANNLTNADPLLGPLGDNGGSTPTLVPGTGSPAIDPGATNPAFTDVALDPTGMLVNDQRQAGFPRSVNGIDIGAVEVQPAATVTISPATLPGGVVGVAYSQALTASGTDGPFMFTVTSGTLPAGLTLSTDGMLTGTPTAAGSSTFTVTATAAGGSGTQDYTLVIGAAGTVTLSPTTLPAATAGTAFSQQLTASGAAGPFTFAVTSGTLPAGLTLGTDGLLSGTPTAAGSSTFTVTATSPNGAGTQQYTLLVNPAGVTVTLSPTTLPAATAGTAFSQQLTASGAAGPFTFAVTSGTLPAGLSLSAAGLLAGTPTAAGNSTFTVTATSAAGAGSQPYTLTVNAAGVTVTLSPTTLPAATAGTAFSQQLTATGAAGPFTFAVSAGSLPAGLALSSSGLLSGTPTAAGSATFTVTATSAAGAGSQPYTLTVNAAPAGGNPRLVGVPQTAIASGSVVSLLNPDRSVRATATPFPGFAGQTRTAAADFNGDGVIDIVAGTGPGGPSQVRILSGVDGTTVLFETAPFEAAFLGGIFVATGDVNGDGRPDLIISPDEGGGPRIDVFSGAGFGRIASFFAFQDDPNFRGGARASAGDVNGDGVSDLVVSAGFGGGPRIACFDGRAVAAGSTNPTRLFNDFFAFENTLRNGAFVAAGDLNADGKADLIFGAGPGGGPRVRAFDAVGLLGSNTQTEIANFFGGDIANRGGIRVAVKNLDGDARADIVTGGGAGASGRAVGYVGSGSLIGQPPEAFAFDAGGMNGVFVG